MDKISIIVPVYNSEKYIKRCIMSVLDQNPVHCQLVLIDDGSSDNSLKIMQQFAVQYEFIKLIHQENQGVSGARNTGIKAATGEWVYFLDSDDEMVPGSLNKIIEFTEQDVQWILFNYYKKIEGEDKKIKNSISANNMEYHLGKEEFPRLLNEQIFMLQCGKVFRRDIIENNNIHFQDKVVYGEDIRFNLAYFQYVKKYILSDIPVFIYHIRLGMGAGSAYYKDSFQMQMDIDKEIMYMVENHYKLSTSAKKELNRYFYYQGINTAAAYWTVWKDISMKERFHEINKIMRDDRFVDFLEKQKEYNDINKLDYFILKNRKFVLYYCIHYIYTKLKQLKRKGN